MLIISGVVSFDSKVKDELLRLGIFRFVSFGFQFRFGVSFARAMTAVAIGVGARFSCPFWDLIVRARMDGFRNLLTRLLVAVKAGVSSRQFARVGLGGSLRGGGYSRSGLVLGENDCSSRGKPDQSNYKEPEGLGLQAFSHPRPLFVRAAYCPAGHRPLVQLSITSAGRYVTLVT